MNVKPGEFLLAVDGVDARTVQNVYALLENKAERVVELRVNAKANAQGSRVVRVKTLASEENPCYLNWVAERRAMVDRLSGGRIGYLHLPNTAVEGNRELNQWLAPLAHKDALIIDDRYNGGGFIPDRMIEPCPVRRSITGSVVVWSRSPRPASLIVPQGHADQWPVQFGWRRVAVLPATKSSAP